MVLPRRAAVNADDNQIDARIQLETGSGQRRHAHGHAIVGSDGEMTGSTQRVDTRSMSPRHTAILAGSVVDTATVIPNDVRHTVGADFNPGSIVKPVLRQQRPLPSRSAILAHADAHAPALVGLPIVNH